MRFPKIIRALFVPVLAFFFVQALFAQTVDRIVAIVNNEVITQSDVNRVLATIEAEYRSLFSDPEEVAQKFKQAEENIISQMIEEKLILSEAKRYEIEAEEDTIEARIEQIKEHLAGIEEFEQALEVQGLTLKDLRSRFRDQEIMKKAVDYFVRSGIKVDPIEMSQYYQAHQESLVHPERAKVKTILIRVDESGDEHRALQKAKGIFERLKKGEKFEELAKAYSQGANAEGGGSLGFVEKDQLIKEIDEAIFKLPAGEFTDVIKTPQGYRIFKVEEKKPKQVLIFEQAQELIRDILYKEKFTEAFKDWLEELKQEAYISINEQE